MIERPSDDRVLDPVRDVWESLAKSDPLWAILSEPAKRGRRWDVAEFFAAGRAEIAGLMAMLARLHPGLARQAALDFGCGVGRLSQPLAEHFERVVGIDISPTMLELARRFDRSGGRVQYLENRAPHLAIVPDASVDLVYSNIVLQHVPPAGALAYVREFFRVTRADGMVVFQLPSHFVEGFLPDERVEAPLAPEVCRARLELVAPVPALRAHELATLDVRVRNDSPITWLQQRDRPLNLANRWLAHDGRVVVNDDGRARLPARLAPGEACDLPLEVRPPDAGSYVLQLDVVQESVRWFRQAGSPTLDRPVTVGPSVVVAPGGATPSASALDPVLASVIDPTAVAQPFDMHGVPYEQVTALFRELGGELLHAEEHVTEWHSFTYFVRMPKRRGV